LPVRIRFHVTCTVAGAPMLPVAATPAPPPPQHFTVALPDVRTRCPRLPVRLRLYMPIPVPPLVLSEPGTRGRSQMPPPWMGRRALGHLEGDDAVPLAVHLAARSGTADAGSREDRRGEEPATKGEARRIGRV
jgi:hypothetical protein